MDKNRKNVGNKRGNGLAGTAGGRFALLASSGETVFHAGDFVNLWHITNKNTLHTTLSRYVGAGNLFRIYKGLYSVKKAADIDPHYLALKAVHSFAYISCETILFENGIINQPPPEITLVSSFSKHFRIAGIRARVRKMQDRFLFNDFGVATSQGVKRATTPRAIADMLYFHPKKYFDAGNSALIDWNAVQDVSKRVGYALRISTQIIRDNHDSSRQKRRDS